MNSKPMKIIPIILCCCIVSIGCGLGRDKDRDKAPLVQNKPGGTDKKNGDQPSKQDAIEPKPKQEDKTPTKQGDKTPKKAPDLKNLELKLPKYWKMEQLPIGTWRIEKWVPAKDGGNDMVARLYIREAFSFRDPEDLEEYVKERQKKLDRLHTLFTKVTEKAKLADGFYIVAYRYANEWGTKEPPKGLTPYLGFEMMRRIDGVKLICESDTYVLMSDAILKEGIELFKTAKFKAP